MCGVEAVVPASCVQTLFSIVHGGCIERCVQSSLLVESRQSDFSGIILFT